MKRKKKTLFIFDPTRKRDSGQGERAPSSKCSIKSQKKNGKNERNLKKNLEESFAKAAHSRHHTYKRARAKNGRTRKTRTGDRFVGFCCL